MRIISAVVLLAWTSPALAEHGTGTSFDFGYVRSRVAVTDQTALDGELARFAVRIVRRNVHFGAEAEEGRLAGTTALPAGAVARTTDDPHSPLGGNTLGLKLLAGVHAKTGAFMLGADVAAGMRDTWVSSDSGPDVAGRKNEPLLELRSRADVWLTSTIALGAVASTDVLERRNVALAAVLSLHFTR